jgi:hypothetical protein
MEQTPQNKKTGLTGVVFTVAVTLGFIWAAVQWYNRYNWPPPISIKDIQANEVQAFKNLQLIIRAQKEYIQTDWDRDGKKNYAKYLVHLWTSVSTESDPIPVGLIPKKLAFAMGASKAIDGYYFLDLHSFALPERGETRKPDYEKEWAITGIPADSGKTGLLTFLADSSGRILVNNTRAISSLYPYEPLSNGWTNIDTVQSLKDFQKTIEYIQK